jgi:hypothetical protein
MVRLIGRALLIGSVALVVYDAAMYFKAGREVAWTTAEQLWSMSGGQKIIELRSQLVSWFGNVGEAVVDLPAAAITLAFGLVFAWIGASWHARGPQRPDYGG